VRRRVPQITSLPKSNKGADGDERGKSHEPIQGYCALCIARCGAIAVVENHRFVALEPDPEHPTGQALCAKRRAAPSWFITLSGYFTR
jgi:anaerobic selenocysteine-containing dehydrogenase